MVACILIGVLAYQTGHETLAYVSWGFGALSGVCHLISLGVKIGKAVKE